jgi:phosphoethanolamine N-methyltransferase
MDTTFPPEELYHDRLIDMLERVWGDGWLSPGGPDELARLLEGADLRGRTVLDIGCGAGGVDVALVRDHGAAYVTGIDVEDSVLARGRALAAAAGLSARIGLVKAAPGPLPFPPATFDVVVSKDAIVHIPDKHALMREVFRVLKPGGWFLASDWLIGHDGPPSPRMQAYIESEGLDFGMASPGRYADAMTSAGFERVETRSRNAWYRSLAREEIARMRGPLYREAVAALGKDYVDHNIAIWTNMLPVLDSGEHCPTHLRARKPEG